MTSTEPVRPSPNLSELVEGARRGEEEAFSELYSRLAPAIFDHLRVLTRDWAAAEDLLQQTFIEAWAGLSSLSEPAKVAPWLYSIARRTAYRHLRSRTLPVPLEETPDLETPGPGPEDVAIADEATRLVWDAAVSLEPRHREALNLSVRRGLGYREIGEILGLRPARAHDLVIRSKEALGRAVEALLVTRSRAACSDLRMLAPRGAGSLTPEQRRSVDHHIRACAKCQGLAFQLTRPEELFGAIILAALPATAQHAPPPPPPLGPAKLAAAHSGAGAPRSLRRRLGLSNRYRRISLGIAVALLLGIGAAVMPLPAPPPSAPKPKPPSLASLWTQDLTPLTSYHISFSTGGPVVIGVTAFDITVGPPGSWYGSVTDASQPAYPQTLAEGNGGVMYVQGGPNFVAVAPELWNLTTGQAQALGNRWLSVDSIPIPNDGNFLETQITPYADPGSLHYEISLPLVNPSATPPTAPGPALFQISADGTVVQVTRGAHPQPLSIDEDPDHLTLEAINQPVTPPDVSSAITWSALTGGSPPP